MKNSHDILDSIFDAWSHKMMISKYKKLIYIGFTNRWDTDDSDSHWYSQYIVHLWSLQHIHTGTR